LSGGYTPSTTILAEDQKKLSLKVRVIGAKLIPFLSGLIYSTRIVFIEENACFTDGKAVYLGAPYIKKYPQSGAIFLYLHEILHIALQHLPRFITLQGNQMEHLLHNILADCVINEHLESIFGSSDLRRNNDWQELLRESISERNVANALNKLLVGDWDSRPQAKNLSFKGSDRAFAILRHLIKPGLGKIGGKGGCPGCGIEIPGLLEQPGKLGSGMSEEEGKKINEDNRRKIEGDLIGGKMRGIGSSNLQEMIEEIWHKPKISWKRMIRNHIKTMLRGNRTWAKFHKKTFCTPLIMPGFNRRTKYSAMIAVDVSGSVSSKQVRAFLGEIYWLTKTHKITIDYVTFDDKIKQRVLIKTAGDIKKCLVIEGRGGTSYQNVMEHAKKTRTKELFVFTDGYGDQNSCEDPGCNTFWIVDNERTSFPFGKKITVLDYE
jgi:predicted metal-dependent peptidase